MQRWLAVTLVALAAAIPMYAQWVQQKSGTTTNLTDVAVLDTTMAVAVGRDGSILKTTDAGQTWINILLAPLFFHPWNAVSFSSTENGSVAGDFGRVAATTDGGKTWLWNGVPGGRNCLSVFQVGVATIYAGDDSGWVHRSVDTGRTWSSVHVSNWPLRSLFAWTGAYTDGLPMFALTQHSFCASSDVLSQTWKETILQAFEGLGSEAHRGQFCVGGGAGFIVGVQGDLRAAPAIVRRAVSDTSWESIATGLRGDGTFFGVSAPSPTIIVVCGDQGMIARSTDGGESWKSAAVPTTRCLRAVAFADEKRGFAVGDSGTILYTFGGGAVPVGEKNIGLPETAGLMQNYPNPFNPTTVIRYALPHRSQVTLRVYNTLGQKVAELVNGEVEAGQHEVKFNGRALASGVYFYRLQVGAFVQTRSLVILK
jgi:photosystem II stability/assembly factor-like uncharacterized protein